MAINYIRNLRVQHGSEKLADSHQWARLSLCGSSVLGCMGGKCSLTEQLPGGGRHLPLLWQAEVGPPNHVYLEVQNVASFMNKASAD